MKQSNILQFNRMTPCALAFVFMSLSITILLLALALALQPAYRLWVKRRSNARIAAMLEYRHVWKEAKFRVVDNTFSEN